MTFFPLFPMRPLMIFNIFLGSALLLMSAGCAPALLGGGVLVEASIADERGLGGTLGDAEIRTKIHTKVARYSVKVFNALNFKVREAKVLITGNTDTPEQQLEVLRLVWTVNGVREVVNEMTVGSSGTVGDYARDSWITANVKTRMLLTSDIPSRNYTVDTVATVVYIMGVAQSQAELNKVTDLASHVSYVSKVVSHVRVKDPSRGFIDADQPPQGSGSPIVQAPPQEPGVRVEPLSSLDPASGVTSKPLTDDTPQPMTPPNF